jgi:hypothetical protein
MYGMSFYLFGPFRLVDGDIIHRAYESILEVINDKTNKKKKQENDTTTITTIDYYEAARIAYDDGQHMNKFLDYKVQDISEINKCFRPIWEFTYRIVTGEEKDRVRVVNRDPDNLLVQWVPGGRTITEILKEMNGSEISITQT